MADPIIRILVEESAPGGSTRQPGVATPSGQAPTPGKTGKTDGDEEGSAAQVAKAMRAMFGRMIPGGQKMLDVLGLGDTFDELAKKVAPGLKRISSGISDFLKDVLGTADKKASPKDGTSSPAEDPIASFVKQQFQGYQANSFGGQKPLPNIDGPGEPGKAVADDMVWKKSTAAEVGPGEVEGTGLIEGLTELAGPIGMAIIAFEGIGKAGEMVAGLIRGIGDAGASIVRNDPGTIMKGAAQGMIRWLDEIPIVGRAVTALPKVFLAVGDAANSLKEAFLQSAQKLSQYSGALSAAEAMAEVRHVLADLEEAQRIGPRLSRVVELQSQTEVEFQKAMVPLKEELLELLIPVMEATLTMAKMLHEVTDGVHGGVDFLSILANGVVPGLGILREALKWIKDHTKEDDKQDQFNALAQQFFDIDAGAENLDGAPAPPGPGWGGAPG